MYSNTFSFSAALCLFLAVGPATILAAPQLPGLPVIGSGDSDTTPTNGNSEHDAGAGFNVGFPGGPGVAFGAGTHRESHGPCGPGVNSQHDAGAGFNVGLPGGPGVHFGAGTHDEHEAVPCPEPQPEPVPVVVPEPTTTSTYIPVQIPPTYTTPIVIPTTTSVPAYVPPSPVPVRSTPLIHAPGPSTTPSSTPVYNAGSAMAPSSLMALALPIMLGIFY